MSNEWRRAAICSTDHLSENCLEIKPIGSLIAIRTSTVPDQMVVGTPAEFRDLVDGIKRGEFDDLIP